ncbi:unnamed protein product [Pleuronectes platessa]|uniref:Uncharacterized protein n=1 Tax=Pleuronectes platessa TaxID=8262 RepID=A0A9N7V3U7_PLEPL|nr:unnamed protein product [Pleuronectes platessa]
MIEARAADNVTHPAGALPHSSSPVERLHAVSQSGNVTRCLSQVCRPRSRNKTTAPGRRHNSLPLAELLQCWGDFPSAPGGRRNDHGHKLSPN